MKDVWGHGKARTSCVSCINFYLVAFSWLGCVNFRNYTWLSCVGCFEFLDFVNFHWAVLNCLSCFEFLDCVSCCQLHWCQSDDPVGFEWTNLKWWTGKHVVKSSYPIREISSKARLNNMNMMLTIFLLSYCRSCSLRFVSDRKGITHCYVL